MSDENPYLAPESLGSPGAEVSPGGTSAPPATLAAGPAIFATITALLAGACSYQAATLVTTLAFGLASVPEAVRGFFGFWVVVNLAAVAAGAWGTYRAIRGVVAAPPQTLAFLLLYSFVLRYGPASFGWPFQLHISFALPTGGAGVNLIGIGLICWWLRIRRTGPPHEIRSTPPRPPATD